MKNAEFVDQAVNELIFSGCAIEVPFQPYIVNPLSVATHKSGKRRLILDLSILNLSIADLLFFSNILTGFSKNGIT
jgi:hypothetical protein